MRPNPYVHIIALFVGILVWMIIWYIYPQSVQEGFDELNKIEMVVARYNESLDWLREPPFNKYDVILYNKGVDADFSAVSTNIKQVIQLDNVGREGHSYLYHIITNYEKLADVTIFLPGSTSIDLKKQRGINVINNITSKNRNVFACQKVDDLYETEKKFTIDYYLSSHKDNLKVNQNGKIFSSSMRPFGKWYKHLFNSTVAKCITWKAIFAVSKETIQSRPKWFYEQLLAELNTHHNPEAGHYIERSWVAIFSAGDHLYSEVPHWSMD